MGTGASSPETNPCNKCGGQAELRCGRCRSAWYCNQDCQKADYPDHKTRCRRFASTSTNSDTSMQVLLPADFNRLHFLRCMGCGKVAMVCPCESDQGLVFVMPPVPPEFTFRQRISRWALLVEHHPLLSVFGAISYVQDRPPSLESDLEFVKPIIVDHMEQYKRQSFGELADKLQILPVHRTAFLEKTKEDADYVVENFFAGNWGYVSIYEYTLLYNAFNFSGPEDHDSDTYPRFLVVWNVLNTVMDAHSMAGIKDPNFRLEDLENIVY